MLHYMILKRSYCNRYLICEFIFKFIKTSEFRVIYSNKYKIIENLRWKIKYNYNLREKYVFI